MKLKKIISCALGFTFLTPLISGCASPKESSSLESGNSSSIGDPEFTEIWTTGVTKTFSEGETYTLHVNADVGANNYIRFAFTTECGLTATMNFVGSDDGAKTYCEDFFIGKGDTEFRQILDYYHENKFNKTLKSIDFECVSGGGELRFDSVSVAVHPIDFSRVNFYESSMDSMESYMKLFIQGETVKLGVNLKLGGAIDYLSSVGQGVGLSYDTADEKVYVGSDTKEVLVIDDDVNLINAFDTGRLIQQSFYGTKGDSLENPKDDYECGKFDHDANDATPPVSWPYNPVQGGDQYQNLSQLVDVQFTESKIYTKCRPMDWAKNGSRTSFYMENTYEIVSDGIYGEYVSVLNKSTDFSGYVHNNVRDQELPAFYGITPLGRMVTYKGSEPWNGKALSYEENLPFWSPAVAGVSRFDATENWIAWVNEDDWGIGLYVPDIEKMLVGRNRYSVDLSMIGVEPSGSMSCTYTAPLGVFSMPTYESFSYRYYLKLDIVDSARELFAALHEKGAENSEIVRLQNE